MGDDKHGKKADIESKNDSGDETMVGKKADKESKNDSGDETMVAFSKGVERADAGKACQVNAISPAMGEKSALILGISGG